MKSALLFYALTALLFSIVCADAITLPVEADTRSNSRNELTLAAGKAGTLMLSARSQTFFAFGVGGMQGVVAPERVTGARVRLYFPLATTLGEITIHRVTSEWNESGGAKPEFDPTPLIAIPASAVGKRKFAVIDITTTVRDWLAGTHPDHGLALATIFGELAVASKEGSGNFPELEIDLSPATGEIESASIADGAISNAKIAADASIDVTKLGAGVVTNQEFGFLSGVSRNLQGQLGEKFDKAGGVITGQTDFNFGASTLSIREENDSAPSIRITGGQSPGTLRLRNKLELWPSDDASITGELDVRDTTGTVRIHLAGESGLLELQNGSARFAGTSTLDFGTAPREMLRLSTGTGIGVQTATQYFRSNGGFAWFRNGSHSDAAADPGPGGVALMTLDASGNLAALGGLSISGNLALNGAIAAKNLPGVEFSSETGNSVNIPSNVQTTIRTITVEIPADGYLFLAGTAGFGASSAQYIVRLRDTTNAASPVTLFSILPLNHQNSFTITHAVQVSAGTRTYDLTIQPGLGGGPLFARNLVAIYLPVRY
jgi:hypothetical protein